MKLTQALEKPGLGILVPVNDEDSPLPLEHTEISVQVIGPLGSVAVTQRFANPFDGPVELKYLFPLPQTAAVIDFELLIGERRIKSDLQEIEQARKTYELAQNEGKHAGLFEERRPNLFSIQIANVMPGETVLATMRYQERLAYDNNSYSFIFPMGITPKYHSPSDALKTHELDAPIAHPGEPIGSVAINLAIDAGIPCGDPSSPSHKIKVTRLDERRFNCHLAEQAVPDHDFVLRYPLLADRATISAWLSQGETGAYFLATLLPPAFDQGIPEPPAREFIFVLDRSGSMTGDAIKQARNALRACLRTLNPQDRFQILLFDDNLEWYQPEPSRVTQAEIDMADTFLAQVEGRGGTEIVAALQAALTRPVDEKYLRYVVFLTDGAVSAEEGAFDQVRRHAAKARIFTFGIGPSVNRALLSKLAQLGRGKAEFLQLDEDIEDAILQFQDRVSFPVLTGIKLHWENGCAWDVYPSNLPDLFAGQPLEIVGRLKPETSEPTSLLVTGQAGEQEVSFSISFGGATGQEPIVNRAWARARIDDLLESSAVRLIPLDQAREEVIGLAIEQRLVTPFTAFVAVDDLRVTKDGSKLPRTIQIAQPLPKGLDLQGFIGGPLRAFVPSAAPQSQGAMYSKQMNSLQGSAFSTPPAAGNKPSLLRRLKSRIPPANKPMMLSESRLEIETDGAPTVVGELLHWLVRTQEINGSWKNEVELTSSALLAFLRAGFTTQSGHYRRQIRRGVDWLVRACSAQPATFLPVAVLVEEAQATTGSGLSETIQEILTNLPQAATPGDEIIKAHIIGLDHPGLVAISNLEDLRLAAILNLPLKIPEKLLKDDLGKIYAACLTTLKAS